MYSEKIKIKRIENGWLVRYEQWDIGMEYEHKQGEKEKAFIYDFEDEKIEVWKKLIQFLAGELIGYDTYKTLYPECKEQTEQRKV